MKYLQLVFIFLIFVSLFADWGGFGSSFIQRLIFGTPNSTDSQFDHYTLFVIMTLIGILIFTVFTTNKTVKLYGSILSAISALLVICWTYISYSFQNFLIYENDYTILAIGWGMPLTIFSLIGLSAIFVKQFKS